MWGEDYVKSRGRQQTHHITSPPGPHRHIMLHWQGPFGTTHFIITSSNMNCNIMRSIMNLHKLFVAFFSSFLFVQLDPLQTSADMNETTKTKCKMVLWILNCFLVV